MARKLRKAIRTKRRIKSQHLVLVFLVLVLGIMSCVALLVHTETPAQQAERENQRYYWQDTKYKGIRTRVSKDSGPTYESIVEHPVTSNPEVNSVIDAEITRMDDEFKESINGRIPVAGEKFRQNISYQVIRLRNSILSIEIVLSRDTQGTTLEQDSYGWTFDLSTGKAIHLTDLFHGNQDGLARFKIYLQRAVAKEVVDNGGEPDRLSIQSIINDPEFVDFLVADGSSLRFDFAEGTVADIGTGPVTVTLPLENLQLFLQTEEARKIIDVMPIGAAPKFKPPQMLKGSTDCSRAKCIALTFDDGPSIYTGQLLDTLKQHHAHASFFLVGQNVVKHKDLVERMYKEGHTVGNHTWSHKTLPYLSPAAIDSELNQNNSAIAAIIGKKPDYMRPPNGAIGPNVYSSIKRLNMTAIMWSVDTRDWADRSSDVVYNRVVSGTKPGAIIILHDIHKTSVDAVPRILKTLQKQGYAFVSVDELFGPNAAPGMAISRAQ